MLKKYILQNIFGGLIFFGATLAAFAQTTAFTYQGKLTDSGTPQTTYQMQFKLFDAVSGGSQTGATITNSSVEISSGVFTVSLDFGAAAFNGADRFLEIAVKKNAGDPFTILTPRQKLTSAPYSITSANALKLGGLEANSYLQTGGDGAGLTNLNADQIASGTVSDTRLSLNIARLDADNVFAANGNSFPQITLAGDGQIIAPRFENSISDPVAATVSNVGRVYFNTTTNSLKDLLHEQYTQRFLYQKFGGDAPARYLPRFAVCRRFRFVQRV